MKVFFLSFDDPKTRTGKPHEKVVCFQNAVCLDNDIYDGSDRSCPAPSAPFRVDLNMSALRAMSLPF